jgi:TetR/AcrR family transcriptional regulator, cholesterol catabolism regulator
MGIESGQDLQQRIVDAARELFFERGYSTVSTQEIADAIGISKKTLYREFETKEDILRAVVLPRLKESTAFVEGVLKDRAMLYMEKLRTVMSAMGVQNQRISVNFVRDVSMHAPAVWREIQHYKQERFKIFGELLKQGFAKNVFRSDIRPEVVSKLYTAAIDTLLTPQALAELPCTAPEVLQSLLTVFFEGMLEEDARKEFRRAKAKPRAHGTS